MEPLDYLDRKQLQLNIMRNIEKAILEDRSADDQDSESNSDLKSWWCSSPNWAKVQKFLNGNSKKAGCDSSIDQCVFLGVNPDGRTFHDMLQTGEPEKNKSGCLKTKGCKYVR